MDYFLAYYQLYYWRIRTPYDLPGEADLFREITQIINDTFTTVSPNLTLCKSLEEAEKSVKAGEEEIMKTLKSKAPQLLQAMGIDGSNESNIDGLQTIMEEDGPEEQNNDDLIYNNIKEDDNVEDNDSYDESGSDYEDQEDNDINEDVDNDDSETEEEDEDTMEEAEYGDDLMDTDDEDSERKELERDVGEWSVKSKPKLIGNIY